MHLTANLGSTFGHASVTRLRDDLVASSEATVSPVSVSSRRGYRQQEEGSGNHVYRKNKNLLLEAIRDVRHQMGKGVYEPGNMLYQRQAGGYGSTFSFPPLLLDGHNFQRAIATLWLDRYHKSQGTIGHCLSTS